MANRYSYLFVPATKADAFLRKLNAAPKPAETPHAVIFDLEDSISESYKTSARTLLHRVIAEHHCRLSGLFRWFVRINDCSSPFHAGDLEMLRDLGPREIAVKLPKCRSREDVVSMGEFHRESAPLMPTIETLEGYGNRESILACASKMGMKHAGFGAGDMSMELGVERDYNLPVLRHVIFELLIAAKCHGLGLIDSPSRVLPAEGRDWESLVAGEAAFAAANGFAGKSAIHPAQVPVIEQTFHSEAKVAWAQAVVADLESQSQTRAIRSEHTGTYCGTPSLKHAKRILRDSDEAQEQG